MASLSKNKIKFIHSLELKKIRKEERVFLAEGPKLVGDLLGHFPCRFLAATPSWFQEHPGIDANELVEVSQEDLSRASLLKTPQQVLAIFEQPHFGSGGSSFITLPCIGRCAGSRKSRYHYPFGRLVWHRTYYLLAEYGRCI